MISGGLCHQPKIDQKLASCGRIVILAGGVSEGGCAAITRGNQMNLGGPATAGFADGLGTVFLSAGTIGVHLDDRAVEGNGFDLDLDDVPSLHGLEDLTQDAAFGPAHHAGIDRVPGSKRLREAPPCAALLGDILNGIQDLKVGESPITPLNWEAMGDLLVLDFADFHARTVSEDVLTGLSEKRCGPDRHLR